VDGEERYGEDALLDEILEERGLSALRDGPKGHADETVVRLVSEFIRLVVHSSECLISDGQPSNGYGIRDDSA
jgi:hypothetical protein